MTHLVESYGLWIVFGIVFIEYCGVPVPGEPVLIAAAVLAGNGHGSIVAVTTVGVAAAVVGGMTGYAIGRFGGRELLARWAVLRWLEQRLVPRAERFFERYGSKAVFFARFVTGIRVVASWLAGLSRMSWWTFAAWNLASGIVWSLYVSLASYYFGRALIDAVSRWGTIAVVVAAVIVAGIVLAVRRIEHAQK